jgi:LPXTG-motif cell wall-anchored protein
VSQSPRACPQPPGGATPFSSGGFTILNSNAFRTPARRCAAFAAAAALTAGPVLLAAPAQATGVEGKGTADAAVLKADLDVSLLDRTADVPLNTSLNAVQAPASADKKALSVTVDGVGGNKPFSLLSADVADAKATVDGDTAQGSVTLADATVHLPGLPLLPLVGLRQVTAKAVCRAGEKPQASSNLLGDVTVLGRRVTLSTGGPTRVSVPGVGDVALALSSTSTTSHSAAATALSLDISVNPLKLNVADVKGSVKLATADCTTPKGHPSGGGHHGGGAPKPGTGRNLPPSAEPTGPGVAAKSAADPKPAPSAAGEDLAETGGSSSTPYIAGGAAFLLAVGAGAVLYAKRAKRTS